MLLLPFISAHTAYQCHGLFSLETQLNPRHFGVELSLLEEIDLFLIVILTFEAW